MIHRSSPADVANALCPWAKHFTSIAPLHPGDIWGAVKWILQSKCYILVLMHKCEADSTGPAQGRYQSMKQ